MARVNAMTDGAELIKRLERATGPDRELDRLLGREFGSAMRGPDSNEWIYPAYTASIDAALTLVPEETRKHHGIWWTIQQNAGSLGTGKTFYVAQVLRSWGNTEEHNHEKHTGINGAAAIALCIAALKARGASGLLDHQSGARRRDTG
jgi:hypothetical protein